MPFIRHYFHSSFNKHGGTTNLWLGLLLNFEACNRERRWTILKCVYLCSWKVISVLFYYIALHRSVPAEHQVLVYHIFRTCACCCILVPFSFACARTNRNTGHTHQRNNSDVRAFHAKTVPRSLAQVVRFRTSIHILAGAPTAKVCFLCLFSVLVTC
jgi:hypothetical protein